MFRNYALGLIQVLTISVFRRHDEGFGFFLDHLDDGLWGNGNGSGISSLFLFGFFFLLFGGDVSILHLIIAGIASILLTESIYCA